MSQELEKTGETEVATPEVGKEVVVKTEEKAPEQTDAFPEMKAPDTTEAGEKPETIE